LKALETDLKNIVYREKNAREVLEYEYEQLSHECVKHMELREASDLDLVSCYKSLQKTAGASPRRAQDCPVG
jgi:hypothetical protein